VPWLSFLLVKEFSNSAIESDTYLQRQTWPGEWLRELQTALWNEAKRKFAESNLLQLTNLCLIVGADNLLKKMKKQRISQA